MRKFKHRITGNVAYKNKNEYNYVLEDGTQFPETLPLWVVENSNDWEEVKEFPKIISFRRNSDKMLYTLGRYDLYWGKEVIGGYTLDVMITQGENTNYTEIYQVAVSETEVFTLGDKVKHPFDDSFDVISKFIICNDPKRDVVWTLDRPDMIGKIVANVGNYFGNCNIEVSRLEKAPEVLFVTEDGVEVREGDTVYWINSNICNYLYSTKFSEFHPAILKGETIFKIFSTKEAAEKYINENKPIYSKKQIREASNELKPLYETINFRIIPGVDITAFNQKLGL